MQWDNTPGGGGPGREFTPDDLLQYMRKFKPSSGKIGPVVFGVLGIVLVLWLATGIYIVGADEEGVVRRFGKVVRTTGPGPHYHLPAPMESVLKPKVTKVFRTEIGFRTISQGPPAKYESIVKEARMLTGDENIIVIWFAVQYKISDSMSYLFNVRDVEKTLRASAEAAMREVIGSNDIDTALTTGKAEVENKSQELLQEIMDSYELGINAMDDELMRAMHKTIDEVTKGVESFGFNAAIARIYAFFNQLSKSSAAASVQWRAMRVLAQLMSPMTPHLSEEIWQMLGRDGLIAQAPWPVADEAMLVEDTVTLPIQINGKRRSEITVPKDLAKEEVEKLALADDAVIKALAGGSPKKLIVVPGRIINVVI